MADLESLSQAVEYMRKKLDMIVEAIIGDPTDELKPGLLIRMDRLERSYANHRKVLTLFGGGLVTVIGTIIAAIILRFF